MWEDCHHIRHVGSIYHIVFFTWISNCFFWFFLGGGQSFQSRDVNNDTRGYSYHRFDLYSFMCLHPQAGPQISHFHTNTDLAHVKIPTLITIYTSLPP